VIFWSIFGVIYYGALFGSVIFLFLWALYELAIGNMKWFKENGAIVFFLFVAIAMAIGIFYTPKKKKQDQPK
jgi:hypothetical protein